MEPSDGHGGHPPGPARAVLERDQRLLGRPGDDSTARLDRLVEALRRHVGPDAGEVLLRVDPAAGVVTHRRRWGDRSPTAGRPAELTLPLTAAGWAWGEVHLLRERPFAPVEETTAASLVAAAADGLRLSLLAPVVGPTLPADAPGMLLWRPGRGPVGGNERARAWMAELGPGGPEVLGEVARRAAVGEPARIRLRTVGGQWVVIHGSGIDTDRALVALVLEPARGTEVAGIVLRAHGLSARELAVVEQVLAGRSTAEIAGNLHISPYTVQDHLKAVFAKVGVRSRRELISRLVLTDPRTALS